jgi:hypothetical protein
MLACCSDEATVHNLIHVSTAANFFSRRTTAAAGDAAPRKMLDSEGDLLLLRVP